METIIKPKYLKDLINNKSLINNKELSVLDGSYFLSAVHGNRNAKVEYSTKRIPNAKFFDIDGLSSGSVDLPHMLPNKEWFINKSKELFDIEIGKTKICVVYDSLGIFSSPRAYFTLKVMMGDSMKIHILDGGLPAWIKDGYDIDTTKIEIPKDIDNKNVKLFDKTYEPRVFVESQITNYIWSNNTIDIQLIDARSSPRFKGEAPEPRQGLHSGSIPHSLNIPFDKILFNDEGVIKFKAPNDIKNEFIKAGVDIEKAKNDKLRIVASCGSGLTACILLAGLVI